jgi:hypothetical protein
MGELKMLGELKELLADVMSMNNDPFHRRQLLISLLDAVARNVRDEGALRAASDGIKTELMADRSILPAQIPELIRSYGEAAGLSPNQAMPTGMYSAPQRDPDLADESGETIADLRSSEPIAVQADQTIPSRVGFRANVVGRDLVVELTREAMSLWRAGRLAESIFKWKEVCVIAKDVSHNCT